MDTTHLDGYRCALDKRGNQHELRLQIYCGGKKLDDGRKIATFPDTLEGLASGHRMLLLLDAICRFLNTGGDLADMENVTDQLYNANDRTPMRLLSPECRLLFTVARAEYDHVFGLPNGKYLRVVEDEFSEELTTDQVNEYFDVAGLRQAG